MFKFALVIQKLGFCLTVFYCYKKIVLKELISNLSRLFHCSVIKVLCYCRISDSSIRISSFFNVVNNFFKFFSIFF